MINILKKQSEKDILKAMEEYKKEYEAEYVNRNSQRFIRYLYKWKQKNQ